MKCQSTSICKCTIILLTDLLTLKNFQCRTFRRFVSEKEKKLNYLYARVPERLAFVSKQISYVFSVCITLCTYINNMICFKTLRKQKHMVRGIF